MPDKWTPTAELHWRKITDNEPSDVFLRVESWGTALRYVLEQKHVNQFVEVKWVEVPVIGD